MSESKSNKNVRYVKVFCWKTCRLTVLVWLCDYNTITSDVNKDWTCKDKDKDQAYKDKVQGLDLHDKDLTHKDQYKDKDLNLVLKDKDKDLTYSYLLQVAAKSTIAIKQQQWTQSENSQHMTVKPITLNK